MMAAAAVTASPLTELELERLENIKRNNALLESLGLGPGRSLLGYSSTKTQSRSRMVGKKRERTLEDGKASLTPATRRSLRNLGKEAPDYKDRYSPQSLLVREGKKGVWDLVVDGSDEQTVSTAADEASRDKMPPVTPAAPAPDSSRSLNADVLGMLQKYLGKKVPSTGKQAVMSILANGQRARFSKYAGVVEWQNAVVLWVNVEGGDYDNLFLNGGREMTWFGPSRATGESPVVQRLIQIGKEREDAGKGGPGESEAGGILLMCRLTGEPYVCMGRVYHVWYDVSVRPVKVLWRLRDYDSLKDCEDFREVARLTEEKVGADR